VVRLPGTNADMPRPRLLNTATRLTVALALLAACAPSFQPRRFATTLDLYRASLQQFQRRKWDNALAGLDLLAQQLPARDTLLADVYWHQGRTHARKGDHLLAAQAYSRIIDAFPDDSIADDALLETGHEYKKLWRKPSLDAQYGQTALATYRQLLTLYPESPLAKTASEEIARLNGMFAEKDFEAGEYYFRRKAYDPALIYFRDVTRLYPGTPSAKASYLRMVQAYQAINYKEEMAEICTEARKFYPEDADVQRACAAVPVVVPADSTRAPTDTTRRRTVP
jgi:outer membrane assembly lipoprotein YfiO